VFNTRARLATRASKKRPPIVVAVPSKMVRKAVFSSVIRDGIDWEACMAAYFPIIKRESGEAVNPRRLPDGCVVLQTI
jgi:hypothetical protein